MKKIALKRLTKSDLTFFIWHFENNNAGNQKAINLNADVFIDRLFPSLPDEALRRGDRFPIDLDIYGPGVTPVLNLQRKIMKGAAYKNWRLNGEFVRDEPNRFRSLQEGDFALIEFEGDAVPFAARLILLAKSVQDDSTVHKKFAQLLQGRSMVEFNSNELEQIIAESDLKDDHPLHGVNLQSEIEDAALGGLGGIRSLLKKRTTRKITRTELKAARNKAEENGLQGEVFVNEYLTHEVRFGKIEGYEWSSNEHPLSPFDFSINAQRGSREYLDVKATTGPFKNPVHVSINELLYMADKAVPYRLYRIYDISGHTAKLRISKPLSDLAATVIATLEKLPNRITADGVTIDPSILPFDHEITITLESSHDE